MALSREEQEVLINMTAADDEASIWTCDPIWKRKLAKLCKKRPDLFKLVKETETSVEYACPKKCIKIGPPRQVHYSPEEQEKRRQWGREAMARYWESRRKQDSNAVDLS